MTALIIPLAALVELLKRPVFWLLYPFAYALRKRVRARLTFWPYCFLNLALDSSIWRENMLVYNQDVEFCWYGKRSDFVEKWLPYDFARSFYWGAWRNSGINLMETTEDWIGEMKDSVPVYSVRTFASGVKLPYLEVWFGGWRFQCGFISCGRFQIQMRKLK